MDQNEQRDFEEEAANLALMEEQDDEELYHPSMIEFEDSWNADTINLQGPTGWDIDIPEWMNG
jgi:hypothetical protein